MSVNKRNWLENFLSGNVYIRCEKEKHAKKLLNYLRKKGINWIDNTLITDKTYWVLHKEDTYYHIIDNKLNLYDKFEKNNDMGVPHYYNFKDFKKFISSEKITFFKLFLEGEINIYCHSNQDSIDFLTFLKSKNIKWAGGHEIEGISDSCSKLVYFYEKDNNGLYEDHSCQYNEDFINNISYSTIKKLGGFND